MENKIKEIIDDFKNKSNKDLVSVLDFTSKEFEVTKEKVITLTRYLDKLENTYNTVLKELNSRNGG